MGLQAKLAIVFSLSALLSVTGCHSWRLSRVPDADIVFQAMYSGEEQASLGFVDGDGSNLTYVEMRLPGAAMPAFPTWTPAGDYLLFRGLQEIDYGGDLFAITPGRRLMGYETDVAFGDDGAAVTADGRYAVVHVVGDSEGEEYLHLLILETGEIKETLVTETTLRAGVECGTNALHGSKLVYAYQGLVNDQERGELILRDLEAGTATVLVTGTILVKPAISPDGRWIAYTAEDGVFIVSVNGGESRRVVDTAVERLTSLGLIEDYSPPVASWSPDSQWIVYHRCTLPGEQWCNQLSHYSVFKVNIETGEEVFLVEGALNPYWRLRQEEVE
jgi:Tol biopolymer transport system component